MGDIFRIKKNQWDTGGKKAGKKTPPQKKEIDSFSDWRLKGIGGSDAPVIMGSVPPSWGNVLELWKIKTGRSQGKPQTYPMKRGLALEPIAREVYEAKTGVLMPSDRSKHKDLDFIRANFDGINWDLGKVLEIKCPGNTDHQVAVSGKIPEKYVWQCVHLLLVTGMEHLDYFSFDGKEGVIVHFQRDKLLEEKLLSEEIPFWDCVTKDIPPVKKEKVVSEQKRSEVQLSSRDLVEFLDRARELGVTSLTLNLNGKPHGYDLAQKEGPSCERHQTPHVEGKYGYYCKECYIERKNR